MKPKTYILLKDLPGTKAGAKWVETFPEEYKWTGGCGCADYFKILSLTFIKSNPEWFKEELPERIMVHFFNVNCGGVNGNCASPYRHDFSTGDHSIPYNKWDSVKNAIEKVLNDDKDEEDVISIKWNLKGSQGELKEKMYSQSEYDKAIEAAFAAGRKGITQTSISNPHFHIGNAHYGSINDYKQSLSK